MTWHGEEEGLGGVTLVAGATDITAEAGMEVTSRSTLGLAGSSAITQQMLLP